MVTDVMARSVTTATPATPFGEIAILLERNRIKRVPIGRARHWRAGRARWNRSDQAWQGATIGATIEALERAEMEKSWGSAVQTCTMPQIPRTIFCSAQLAELTKQSGILQSDFIGIELESEHESPAIERSAHAMTSLGTRPSDFCTI